MSGFLHRARFTLDHRWTPGRMSAYLDGELAERALRRLERHVGECHECRRLLAELRRMLGALKSLPAPSDGAGALEIAAAVRARLEQRE